MLLHPVVVRGVCGFFAFAFASLYLSLSFLLFHPPNYEASSTRDKKRTFLRCLPLRLLYETSWFTPSASCCGGRGIDFYQRTRPLPLSTARHLASEF